MNNYGYGVMAFIIIVVEVIIVVAAYYFGKRQGRKEIEDQIEAARLKAENTREKINHDVAKRPDAQLDRDVDKWMRD